MIGDDGVQMLLWRELAEAWRAALPGTLDGLYGHLGDEGAFEALEIDKQQALLIFVRRFSALKLWPAVQRIENVYGTGGVGMNFHASPSLAATLSLRKDFTKLFASQRRKNVEGFRELRRPRAALHFLYQRDAHEPRWSVHFDLYNPLASLLSAGRHVFYESRRSMMPDWRVIRDALEDQTS